VITSTGGTLGATSAYGVGDPSITRRRVEADLAVFLEYQTKYRGMFENCKQKLEWGVERYAKIPPPPELLELKQVPTIWNLGCLGWIFGLIGILFGPYVILLVLSMLSGNSINQIAQIMFGQEHIMLRGLLSLMLLLSGFRLFALVPGLFNHFRVKAANGDRPAENARRQWAYENAKTAALRAAVPLKEAEDHRLRVQIRELEGLIKTVGDKAADVRRIMETL
jgi:hypothetical protein